MSRTIKTLPFRFGVDVDNVLANSSGKALELLNARRNLVPPVLRDEITKRPFHNSPGFVSRGISQDEVSAVLDEAWRSHHLEIRPMDPNMQAVIRSLRELDILVDIITTMGARDHSIRPRMKEWLDHNEVPHDTLNFVSSTAEKVAFPVGTIVDDEESLAIKLKETGRPGILYSAPWNREFVRQYLSNPQTDGLIIPVENWTEVGERVIALIESLRT